MTAFPSPGLQWSDYPERVRAHHNAEFGVKAWIERFGKLRGSALPRWLLQRRYAVSASRIHQDAARLSNHSEQQLEQLRRVLMRDLRKPNRQYETIRKALSYAGAISYRTLGLKPFETQYVCALALLDQRFAEMATGEGKTIAAALAAAVAGLAGSPVHMLTANDYLAARDGEKLKKFFSSFDLSVGAALESHSPDERLQVYSCNIVYATAKTIAFDYLRDRLQRSLFSSELERRLAKPQTSRLSSGLMLTGLCVAIVDEADSILIDEAKIPLIISDEKKDASERARLWQSLDLARQLCMDIDFRVHGAGRFVKLTEAGKKELAKICVQYGKAWINRLHREELVTQALVAIHVMKCDIDYIVRDKKIHIVDSITGRIAEGRVWSRGLHGLIALKENVTLPPNTETLASITFPRFFDRYHHLCGLSGTIEESSAELKSNYMAAIVRVPLRLPSQRKTYGACIFATERQMLERLTARVRILKKEKRPVLIATDSVEASQRVRMALHRAGFEAQLLNARHDEQEAVIVAQAGQMSALTVATQMAGRGTDISLGDGVAQIGGLHVINLQLNSSPRQDRQVRGRCARQGDPGSYEHWICADCSALSQRFSMRGLAALSLRLPILTSVLLFLYQKTRESDDLKQREQVKRRDQQWAKQLSFAKIVE